MKKEIGSRRCNWQKAINMWLTVLESKSAIRIPLAAIYVACPLFLLSIHRLGTRSKAEETETAPHPPGPSWKNMNDRRTSDETAYYNVGGDPVCVGGRGGRGVMCQGQRTTRSFAIRLDHWCNIEYCQLGATLAGIVACTFQQLRTRDMFNCSSYCHIVMCCYACMYNIVHARVARCL